MTIRLVPDEKNVKRANGRERRLRRHLEVNGLVIGVGMRPFVLRLATELGLGGWVRNAGHGVAVEVEGHAGAIDLFKRRLTEELPSGARVESISDVEVDLLRETDFRILPTEPGIEATVGFCPDVATCHDCLQEVLDPQNRRYRYPFTNCAHCGPRYSITRRLPFERANTTMAPFEMCEECRTEYEDPASRRFRTQSNACPRCGPCYWIEPAPPAARTPGDVIHDISILLLDQRILAIKGTGGFHLVCVAKDDAVVQRLRRRKEREMRPLPVMVPSLEAAERLVFLTDEARRQLQSPAAPIVLAPKRYPEGLAPSVAPDTMEYGLMLPHTPFHHLLMDAVRTPVVMTTANLSGEPILIDNDDARQRLSEMADHLVLHDREIHLGCDDSVLRVDEAVVVSIRRSRGYAPAPVALQRNVPPILALGGLMRVTVAVSRERSAFLSQDLGDVDNVNAADDYRRAVAHMQELLRVKPDLAAYDLHPLSIGYQIRAEMAADNIGVQHHHAHVASVLAEHALTGPVVGVALDGAGYGPDGTIWGGEFLLADAKSYRRVAHAPRFRLPGGDGALRHPWRAATGILWDLVDPVVAEMWAHAIAPSKDAADVVLSTLATDVECVPTTSLGRIYDCVAAILGLCRTSQYQAQAALLLEQAAGPPTTGDDGTQTPDPDTLPATFFGQVLRTLLEGTSAGRPVRELAAWAQRALARWVAFNTLRLAREHGVDAVAASGGCLVNPWLKSELRRQCAKGGLTLYTNRQVPAGDGGLALGQILVAAAGTR
jgi:hydrogenase maturation protein HypF